MEASTGRAEVNTRQRREVETPTRGSGWRWKHLHAAADGGFDREGGGEHPGRDTPVRARRQANRDVCATAAAGTRDAALPGRSAPRAYREAMADRGRGVIEAKQSTGRRRTLDTSYHRCEGGLRRIGRLPAADFRLRELRPILADYATSSINIDVWPTRESWARATRTGRPDPGGPELETRHAPRLELAPQAQRTPVLRAERRGRFGCRG